MIKFFYNSFCLLLFIKSISFGQVSCCCGTAKELDFPGFDFEFAPAPAPGWFIPYGVGPMGPWDVTAGFIDHVDKDHYFCTGCGNPNGASTFADLYGSPPSGSVPGTMRYTLTGLNPGYLYTLEFYYAKFDVPGNFKANIKVANGAWLNVSLTATNSGNIIWLKASYNFIAQTATTNLEFMDASSAGVVGVLIDDIKIYECPNDTEKPKVNNPPDNLEVECDNEVPGIPQLDISDNCDLNPIVTFKEIKDVIDACTKKITRSWTIKDACGNITIQQQIIDIIDKTQPQFSKFPENKTVYCSNDVIAEFNDWIKKNGSAIATDPCGLVTWRSVILRIPKNTCDSVAVDFIAIDPCGNENVETAFFIVKDSTPTKFIIKPQNKNFISIPNIRDSLRSWLNTFGFSTTSTSCDTSVLSSNFNGDSTKNPLLITFYVKDHCGNTDSATASFAYQINPVKCCCGSPKELDFPGLDFEISPFPPPLGFFPFVAVGPFGPWTVTNGAIDEGDPMYCGFLAAGNPNGASYFIDLFGSPPTGSVAGTLEYLLYGLTPGYTYTIEFWYATFTANGNFSANLKVANGAWLNVNWSANNPGSVIWLKNSYSFVAKATTAAMSFTDTGPSSATYQIGMLLDDIKIFECPSDIEKPVVNNPPIDYVVECDIDVPNVPTLDISDNCDLNPTVKFKETKNDIDACTKKITREWNITDACGNITIQNQIIDVIDKNPPQFTKSPQIKTVFCTNDVTKEFNDWIKNNGDALVKDACDGAVNWRINYDHLPKKYCDTVLVAFIVADLCGNENTQFANFIVRDTTAPKFIVKATNKNFVCVPGTKDSLRNWLTNYGFSQTSTTCDTVILSSNFTGDSTMNPLMVTFYAKDRCGNIDSCMATFTYRSASDTIRINDFSCSFLQNSKDTFRYNVHSCDSIVIVTKIKLFSDSSYIQLKTCDPLQKKFDTIPLVNRFGCDSFIFKEYVLHPAVITNFQKMDCAYAKKFKDTIFFQGQFCDSLVITEYLPLRKDSISTIINTCDQSKVDTSIFHLINSLGCDSTLTVYTIYTPQQISFIDKKICGLLKSFIDTVKFTSGICDSLVITTHAPSPLDTTTIQSTTCDPTQAGIFSNTIANQYGCDSLIIHHVLLNPSDSIFISKSTCDFFQSGIQIQHYQNKFGCDSIVKTTTIYVPNNMTTYAKKTCKSSEIRSDTLYLKNSKGCDSIVYYSIQFVPSNSDTFHITQTTCTFLDAKKDTLIYPRSNFKCDSVIYRTINFVHADTTQIAQTSCIPADAGLTTTLLQNSKGCDSLVLINTNYVPLHLEFTLDSITCYNRNDGQFKITNTSDFSAPFIVHFNGTDLSNLNQINNLAPGFYKLYVRDQKGCFTDSIQFSLQNPPELIIDLGNDLDVKSGTTIDLNLQSNKIVQNIFWQPSYLSNCNNCNSIRFIVNQDMWVYAQAIDERNCTQTDSIFIRVRKSSSIYAPNSFSPNGDNINDYFYILGDDKAIVVTLFIYDRWGNKLFETHDIPLNVPTAGWNGTFNAQQMNPGVYIYYAKVRTADLEILELKGDLTLIR